MDNKLAFFAILAVVLIGAIFIIVRTIIAHRKSKLLIKPGDIGIVVREIGKTNAGEVRFNHISRGLTFSATSEDGKPINSGRPVKVSSSWETRGIYNLTVRPTSGA